MRNLLFLICFAVIALAGCSMIPASSVEKDGANESVNLEATGDVADHKQLPIDVEQFVKNYKAVAKTVEGEPLPLPEDLEVTDSDNTNIIELQNSDGLVFNLVLNKDDDSLRAISYTGPGDIYTFWTVAGALDITDHPDIQQLISDLESSNEDGFGEQIELDNMTLDFSIADELMSFSFYAE